MTDPKRPRLLDLFCGAGGAAMGYHKSGFEIVGIDIEPQPNYPFAFIQLDALSINRSFFHQFHAIHASPPCQIHSRLYASSGRNNKHMDLVPPTRDLLISSNLPWVMENVLSSGLIRAVMLCGTMFNLKIDRAEIRRHRLFETSFDLFLAPKCDHRLPTMSVTGSTPQRQIRFNAVRETYTVDEARQAMGIHWMTMRELSQAIPPAYTEWIGRHLLKQL